MSGKDIPAATKLYILKWMACIIGGVVAAVGAQFFFLYNAMERAAIENAKREAKAVAQDVLKLPTSKEVAAEVSKDNNLLQTVQENLRNELAGIRVEPDGCVVLGRSNLPQLKVTKTGSLEFKGHPLVMRGWSGSSGFAFTGRVEVPSGTSTDDWDILTIARSIDLKHLREKNAPLLSIEALALPWSDKRGWTVKTVINRSLTEEKDGPADYILLRKF